MPPIYVHLYPWPHRTLECCQYHHYYYFDNVEGDNVGCNTVCRDLSINAISLGSLKISVRNK